MHRAAHVTHARYNSPNCSHCSHFDHKIGYRKKDAYNVLFYIHNSPAQLYSYPISRSCGSRTIHTIMQIMTPPPQEILMKLIVYVKCMYVRKAAHGDESTLSEMHFNLYFKCQCWSNHPIIHSESMALTILR